MLIVGELINSSRRVIREAIASRDCLSIQELAVGQLQAGAACIDVNCGTEADGEAETMEWLVNCVLDVCPVPLCIDSPDEKTLAAGLAAARPNQKQQMINSITAEKERYNNILPLARAYQAKVVALCMGSGGLPESLKERCQIVEELVVSLTRDGIPEDDIYLDPLVRPVSTGDRAALDVLDTISYIKSNFPRVHVICGVSNVSFGMPARKLLNKTFLVQAMAAGLDAAIIDPADEEIMASVYASRALLGQDEYCLDFLAAYRQGLCSGKKPPSGYK